MLGLVDGNWAGEEMGQVHSDGSPRRLCAAAPSLSGSAYRDVIRQYGIHGCKAAVRELVQEVRPLAAICGSEGNWCFERYIERGEWRLHYSDGYRCFLADLTWRHRLPLMLCYNLVSRSILFRDPQSRRLLAGARAVGDYWEIDRWKIALEEDKPTPELVDRVYGRPRRRR